ncbi:MAG TPA: hypothetical protein VHG32_12150 [Thermoanaerobaculia bacterium]|jgi:hypothetical protein|nr:hypothetical protein [Thermoanaerobaculia bacterium]
MPSYRDVTPPPLDEGDSFRETTLQLIDDPEDREAMRRFGRLLYHLALEATMESGTGTDGESSVTRAELRAVAGDFRSLGGYLRLVEHSAVESSLEPPDAKLARFAGKLSRQVGALVEKIERRLS